MGFKIQRKVISRLAVLLLSAVTLALLAQNPPKKSAKGKDDEENLVYLLKAQSLQQYQLFGEQHRKALSATFLHNGMYLISDTADWNVDTKIILATGHVKLIQGDTRLTSERLTYVIDEDLAIFSGVLVQLENKRKNLLRTQHLDYNTRDSVAVFSKGASMRDEDGQVIESADGTYDSKTEFFTFSGNVNMFTDSVFVKTEALEYDSRIARADFVEPIDFWNGDNMLSSRSGWYAREAQVFFFTDEVHGLTPEREGWADTMYVYRETGELLLRGNAQLRDTVRGVTSFADRIHYLDSTETVTMERNVAAAIVEEENGKTDTAYVGADRLVYRTVRHDSIPAYILKKAESRIADLSVDAVQEYRAQAAKAAAEAAAKAREEKEQREHGYSPKAGKGPGARAGEELPPSAETPDTTAAPAPADSLSAPVDSLPPVIDTTKIGFLYATGDVRIFREDIQVRCDSLDYTDLDSIARFYGTPFIWNAGNRQYTADSVYVLIHNGKLEKANLLSEAFIITQEDTLLFNQIKGAEVMAYFDTTAALRRFDALGGAVALFYLEENGQIATANKVQSKMLSATLKDGDVDRVYYFETPKNDAFPLAQMPSEDKRMKGFNWEPERRPKGRRDITTKEYRATERAEYSARPRPAFPQTIFYFPGYMEGIWEDIALRKQGIVPPPREKPVKTDKKEKGKKGKPSKDVPPPPPPVPPADSPELPPPPPADSLELPPLPPPADSLGVPPADSVASLPPPPPPPVDSLGQRVDTLLPPPPPPPPPSAAQLERLRRDSLRRERQARADERREAARLADSLRTAERDAKWARLDSLDAAKKAAKDLKKLEKKRKRTLRQVRRRDREEARDRRRLEKYIAQYEQRKRKEESKRREP